MKNGLRMTSVLPRAVPLAVLGVVATLACAEAPAELARDDLDRVAVGDEAPDFSLMSYRGDVLTLSENRGAKEIVLVFYRGHW